MKSKSSISSRSGVRRRIVDGQDSCKMVDNTPMSRSEIENVTKMRIRFRYPTLE